MYFLQAMARLCAILAGLLMTGITLMTCVSILGREFVGQTLTGDFELSGAATGAAIAMFMPWCQYKRGNIIVDFFTTGCSAGTQEVMDRIGTLLVAACFALLAHRTLLGGMSAYQSMSGTMILGFPEWIVYAFMAPSFLLTCLIALMQTVTGFDEHTENPA